MAWPSVMPLIRTARRPPQHRDGPRLVHQPRRIAADGIGIELDHAKGIVAAPGRGLDQRVDALAHQAFIGAEDQDRGGLLARILEEVVDLTAVEFHGSSFRLQQTRGSSRG